MSADRIPDFGSAFGHADEVEEAAEPAFGSDTVADGAELEARGLSAVAAEISRVFAPQLEHTALVLYDRDPEHLQAQWYVTPEELAQARSLFPGDGTGLRQVLRLCRLDQDGKAEVAESVPQGSAGSEGEGQQGFALSGDSAEYECELGLESEDGGWILLARSGRVRLANRSLPPPPRAPEPSRTGPEDAFRSQAPTPIELDGVKVDAALAAVGEPLYPVFPDLELEDSPPAASFAPMKKAYRDFQARDRRTEIPHRPPESRVPHQETVPGLPLEADLATMPPPLLPSSPDLGAPAADIPGALYDPRAALSSASLRGVQPQWGDIEIRAELIVQGRAPPRSTIELFGHPVTVGEDGRFYVRRPIEDQSLLSLVIGGHPQSGIEVREPE
ncbi:MAG: DUF4912 domain-containing protein [Chromatiaceae bacterium]|nr:DUF4912 domain-containing protein [Chromatiaceae bacterium]